MRLLLPLETKFSPLPTILYFSLEYWEDEENKQNVILVKGVGFR